MKQILPLIVLALCSCSMTYQAGTKFDAEQVTEIVLNETTQEEVQQLFGDPSKTAATVSGVLIWQYASATTKATGWGTTQTNSRYLQIHLHDGVVVDNLAHVLEGAST